MGIIVNNIQRGTLAFKGKGVSRVFKGADCVYQKAIPELIPDGCIAYFKCDETGGGVATDELGIYNGVNSNIVYGNAGNNDLCYKFNGVDSNIEIPYLLPLYNFSVSIWVNAVYASNDVEYIIDTYSAAGSYFSIWYYRGELRWRLKNTRALTQSGVLINGSEWTHIVATVDNIGYIRIYIDGLLKETKLVHYKAEVSEQNIRVGLSWFYGRNPYSSLIDDLMLFDKFLSTTEVADIYNSQKQ